MKITGTQLRKSTINANKVIRKCLQEGGTLNFDAVSPGEKVLLPCRLVISGSVSESRVSLLIPRRRGSTSPEPRLWPHKLAKAVKPGTKLWFVSGRGSLEVRDSPPTDT